MAAMRERRSAARHCTSATRGLPLSVQCLSALMPASRPSPTHSVRGYAYLTSSRLLRKSRLREPKADGCTNRHTHIARTAGWRLGEPTCAHRANFLATVARTDTRKFHNPHGAAYHRHGLVMMIRRPCEAISVGVHPCSYNSRYRLRESARIIRCPAPSWPSPPS